MLIIYEICYSNNTKNGSHTPDICPLNKDMLHHQQFSSVVIPLVKDTDTTTVIGRSSI